MAKKKAKQRHGPRHGQARPQPPRPGGRLPADPEALARQAEALLARGNVELACELLAPVRSKPDNAALRDVCARAYLLQAFARWDRPARAAASVERALEAAPDRADLRRLHGHLLRRTGRSKPAAAELAEAIRLAPASPHLAYETALVKLAAGEPVVSDGRPAALDPASAARVEALTAARVGDLARAEQVIAAFAAQRPLDGLIHGVILLAEHQVARAIRTLERVVAQVPETDESTAVRGPANLYLGIAHVQRRQPEQAVEALERARDLGQPVDHVQPYLAWVYRQLAVEAALAGDYQGAADQYLRLEALGGPDAPAAHRYAAAALRLYGQEQIRKEDYDEAVEAWSGALELTPDDLTLRQQLAIALERADRPDEAIPHWEALVRARSRGRERGRGRDPAAHRQPRGRTERRVDGRAAGQADGRAQPAEDSLEQHLLAVAHRHLGGLLLDEDDVDGAIEHYEKALEVVPSDVDTRRELAALLLDEAQIQPAIEHLKRVAADAPENANDRLQLGIALLVTGKSTAAKEHLERGVALEPENPTFRSALSTALARSVLEHPREATAAQDAERAAELAQPAERGIALLALGATQLARGELPAAKKTFREALPHAPEKATALARIGHLYWDFGQQKLALSSWNSAMKQAKRSRLAYGELIDAWARVGDADKCQQCVMAVLQRDDVNSLVNVAERLAANPQLKTFFIGALHRTAKATESPLHRAYLAEGLYHGGDVPGARALLNAAGRDAAETADLRAITEVTQVDLAHRLLDRKTGERIYAWMDTAPPALRALLGLDSYDDEDDDDHGRDYPAYWDVERP
ncbi:MAG: tetratricopeptide repeat protein [Chloroflexi bacterium]|nr:tetratricopeptide repeat protein [Chloroflexota bacterium]